MRDMTEQGDGASLPMNTPSITEALSGAWQWMIHVLFSPFNIEKWCVMGFCAFLAYLGTGLGNGGNVFNNNFSRTNKEQNLNVSNIFETVGEHFNLFLLIISVAVIAGIAIGLVLIWLNSRGKFMFLDGVVRNRGAVRAPWSQFASSANNLFLFRIVLGLIFFTVSMVIIGVTALSVFPALQHTLRGEAPVSTYWTTTDIVCLSVGAAVFVAWSLLLSLVQHMVCDFALPVMYRYRITTVQAVKVVWAEFIHPFPKKIIFFYAMKILLGIAGMFVFIGLSAATCCLFCCISSLPYIGVVLCLPYYVFMRAYSLFFIAQFGEHWSPFAPVMSSNEE